jgi:hypothetical protein
MKTKIRCTSPTSLTETRMRLLRCCLLTSLWVVVLIFHATLFGQSGTVNSNYTYRHFTTKDGLPQIQCIAMLQDSRGFLWVGTKFGLARWDGRSFRVFNPRVGVPLQTASFLHETSDGSIIAGSGFNDVIIIKGEEHRELEVMHEGHKVAISGFFNHPEAHCFIINGHYPANSDSLVTVLLQVNTKTLEIKEIAKFINQYVIACKDEKHIITHTNGGNRAQFPDTTTISLYHHRTRVDALQIPYSMMTRSDAARFHTGEILLFPNKPRQPSYLISSTNDKLVVRPSRQNPGNALRNQVCLSLSTGELWYLNIKKELRYRHGNHDELIGNVGLSNNILRDREGNIWVSGENGLYCFFRQAFREITLDVAPGDYDMIWSMATDGKGKYLYASYHSGVAISDDHNKTWHKPKALQNIKGVDANYKNIFTFGTHHTALGGWIVPAIGGLVYYKNNIATFFPYRDPKFETFFTLEDSLNHRIYVSGYQNIYCLDEKTLKMDTIFRYEEDVHFTCLALALDRNQQLVAFGRGQPKVYEGGKWKHLPNCDIRRTTSAWRDYNGNLWITSSDALYFYDYKQLVRISEVPTRAMHLALTGYKEFLVIGGSVDLVFMDLKKFYQNREPVFHRFDAGSGLNILEGGQNSFYHDADGSIYWCCSDKVIQFFPDKLLESIKMFHPTILKIRAAFPKDLSLTTSVLGEEILNFSKGYRYLTFDFSTALFNNNDMLRHRYRLVGYDADWQQTTELTATYRNIKPGTYNFELQASVDGIHWSETTTSQPITIPAYWHEKMWVKWIGIFALVVMLTVFILLVTSRRRKARYMKLRREADFNHLQLQTIRSKHIPHFTGNVFSNIDWLIESGEYKEASRYISILSKLFNRILAKSDRPASPLDEEICFAEDYLKLEKLRFNEKLQYSIEQPELMKVDVLLPNMILQTLVENAIKHGIMGFRGYGSVRIIVTEKPEGVIVVVEDDGIGREAAKDYNKHSTKNGLKIMQQQIAIFNEKNKAKISFTFEDLKDEAGAAAGTRAILFVPYGFNYF